MSQFFSDFSQKASLTVSDFLKNDISLDFQMTSKEHTGDFTIIVFPFVRFSKLSPEDTSNKIGAVLQSEFKEYIISYNVIKGFLNLELSESFFLKWFGEIYSTKKYGFLQKTDPQKILLEYSSPNTNKPLHLGHIRNNLLGYSVYKILQANGHKVFTTQIINDRGIHICKSMVAWKDYGNGETPESTNMKGDTLVGKYYVLFEKKYQEQIKELLQNGSTEEEAKKNAPILKKAYQWLQLWEEKDAEIMAIWEKMNKWVYAGFDITYKKLGVHFDFTDYESNTYILGKDIIQKGLKEGVFYQKQDKSIWVDLSDKKMDHKLLLRGDGTSVYISQDLGTAVDRMEKHNANSLIYTVGNEQNYHFKVLFEILKKLNYDWAKNLHHLSYGMVNLPSGKMKSREGTVVDADELISELEINAENISKTLGKLSNISPKKKAKTYEQIALGALKYYILRVDHDKSILFDPSESIDFNGNTGPFIQYTYVRIRSLLKNEKSQNFKPTFKTSNFNSYEKAIIIQLSQLPNVISKAGENFSPSVVANFIYDLVKYYNTFYQNCPILKLEDELTKDFRLTLSHQVKKTIKYCMALLGVEMPKKM